LRATGLLGGSLARIPCSGKQSPCEHGKGVYVCVHWVESLKLQLYHYNTARTLLIHTTQEAKLTSTGHCTREMNLSMCCFSLDFTSKGLKHAQYSTSCDYAAL
jgi:hypothetical protein